MNAARRNARRLAEDARLLLEAARYPSATALAILSIEESGKNVILRQIAGSPNDNMLRDAWKNYRSHRHKNAMWILPDLVRQGARHLTSLQPAADPSAEHTALLDQVKQISLYTDCLGNAHWSEPQNVIDENLAATLVKIAALFAERRTTTARELELWIEHMGPVYGAPLQGHAKSASGLVLCLKGKRLVGRRQDFDPGVHIRQRWVACDACEIWKRFSWCPVASG